VGGCEAREKDHAHSMHNAFATVERMRYIPLLSWIIHTNVSLYYPWLQCHSSTLGALGSPQPRPLGILNHTDRLDWTSDLQLPILYFLTLPTFVTAQPGFYHCTNVVYPCLNGQWYQALLTFISPTQWCSNWQWCWNC